MSSPMPIDPGMCSLCFDQIYPGEHWVDERGQHWDSHIWCHLMDQALTARKTAAAVREARNQPCIED